jgi:hypothetical protein
MIREKIRNGVRVCIGSELNEIEGLWIDNVRYGTGDSALIILDGGDLIFGDYLDMTVIEDRPIQSGAV